MSYRIRILLVADEPEFADFLQRGLTQEGYSVGVVHSAHAGWQSIQANRPDLLLLNLKVSAANGLAFCQQLRQAGQQLPILLLTAPAAVAERLVGFQAGADGYLPEPFALGELLARLRALLRRQTQQSDRLLTFADVTLWLDQRKLQRSQQTRSLSAKEFAVLELFFRHPDQVFTRSQLLEQIWGYDTDITANVVDVCVHRLRVKLGAPSLITTIRRVGYVLRPGKENIVNEKKSHLPEESNML